MISERLKLKFENAATFVFAGAGTSMCIGLTSVFGLAVAGMPNESVCLNLAMLDTIVSASPISSWKECMQASDFVANQKTTGQYIAGGILVAGFSLMSYLGFKGMKMSAYAFKNDLRIIINNGNSPRP